MGRAQATPKGDRISIHASMSDIYARLNATGFDPDFVRMAVLPDWWEDSLAEIPANRALAEILIARNLGMSVVALSKPSASLAPAVLPSVKFKRRANRVDSDVAPTVLIARRAAQIVINAIPTLPLVDLPADPLAIRRSILLSNRLVDLESLLAFCWSIGIVVLYLDKIPSQSKRCDGLAMFCEGRPVVVLGSRRDGPAWLAFHLAHEVSHILCHHVTKDSAPLVDGSLESAIDDLEERQADEGACELLTGLKTPQVRNLGLTGPGLANRALQFGPSAGIDPGVYALIYGKSNDRWGVAQNALKVLHCDTGAHATIVEDLKARVNPGELPEESERFVAVLSLS